MALSVGDRAGSVASLSDFGDGVHVASGNSDGKVRIHNIVTGAKVLSFDSGESVNRGVVCVAVRNMDKEGSYLVVHAAEKVQVAIVAKDATGRMTIMQSTVLGRVLSGRGFGNMLPKSVPYANCVSRGPVSGEKPVDYAAENSVTALYVSFNCTRIMAVDERGVIYV